MNSGVHSSLHSNCHHQIIHAKFNLKISYPPPYEQVVWHYQDANNDLIHRLISQFNWERAFSNKGVNTEILKPWKAANTMKTSKKNYALKP